MQNKDNRQKKCKEKEASRKKTIQKKEKGQNIKEYKRLTHKRLKTLIQKKGAR